MEMTEAEVRLSLLPISKVIDDERTEQFARLNLGGAPTYTRLWSSALETSHRTVPAIRRSSLRRRRRPDRGGAANRIDREENDCT